MTAEGDLKREESMDKLAADNVSWKSTEQWSATAFSQIKWCLWRAAKGGHQSGGRKYLDRTKHTSVDFPSRLSNSGLCFV